MDALTSVMTLCFARILLTQGVAHVRVVHELEPEKMGIWLPRVDKTKYRFLVTSGCLLSRKV